MRVAIDLELSNKTKADMQMLAAKERLSVKAFVAKLIEDRLTLEADKDRVEELVSAIRKRIEDLVEAQPKEKEPEAPKPKKEGLATEIEKLIKQIHKIIKQCKEGSGVPTKSDVMLAVRQWDNIQTRLTQTMDSVRQEFNEPARRLARAVVETEVIDEHLLDFTKTLKKFVINGEHQR